MCIIKPALAAAYCCRFTAARAEDKVYRPVHYSYLTVAAIK